MTVLVTGGAGYIGSHIVLDLLARGHRIAVLDNLATGRRASLPPQVAFHKGDICEPADLESVFSAHSRTEPIDSVIHAAAMASVPESVSAPDKCFAVNLDGTKALAAAAHAAGAKRFIFSSTSAVYDDAEPPPHHEESRVRPLSPYAESKYAAERYLAEIASESFAVCVLRYFNVAGADARARCGDCKRAATTLIKTALEVAAGKREQLEIYGTDYPTPDGTAIRDYIHVSDVAAAQACALDFLQQQVQADTGGFHLFNLGSGKGFSVMEVIETVESVLQCRLAKAVKPRRAGDPAALFASAEKAKQELAWQPSWPQLDAMIAHGWAWEQTLRRQAARRA